MNNLSFTPPLLRGAELKLVSVLTMMLSLFATASFADTTAPVLNDSSYYEISTAAQLKWFADKVNAGDNAINGVLTADIDVSTLDADYWTPIGLWDENSQTYVFYKGKFNGQNHTVSGIVLRKASASGLFGVTQSATISNVIVTGAKMKAARSEQMSSIQYGIGSVCGVALAGTVVENCHSTMTEIIYTISQNDKCKDIDCVGGIVGELRESTAKDCSVNGYVRTDGSYVGGIVGFLNSGLVQSCHFRNYDNGCSAVVGIDNVGCIAGYLQGRTRANAIVDCTVADSVIFNATAGVCDTICAKDTLLEEPGMFNSCYEIYTPAQLQWFATKVNGGSTSINGKLMNDINMSGKGYLHPIGSSDHPFSGVFDGQEFTVDSVVIWSQSYAGMFGYVKDGVIKNVNLNRPWINALDYDYIGLIAGFLTQDPNNKDKHGYIENCNVTNGQIVREGSGTPDYIGGIVGKIDMSAEVRDCSFQGTIKAHENRIGGIAGYMDSGAKLYRCTTIGPSTVWGNNYVGGVVGYMTDNSTTIDNCDVDQSTGAITIHAESGNYSGLVRGYDKTGGVTKTKYNEGGLQYEVTGKKVTVDGKSVTETHITGVSTSGQGTYYACVDIGSSGSDYFNTVIESVNGAEELYFWDNVSNLAGTKACGWINMTINDYAFGSNFKSLKMYYHMFAGDDHDVMLRPSDVRPAGDNMFANCPNAKVYVDAEYYDEFCNDEAWSKYKKYLVPVTSMRTEDVNAEYGARYAYDRNCDKTGSIVKNGNVHQVHVIGADDSYINDKDNNNTLWIYQDIGQTYDYNTTKIWASSFKGKENIKQVKFQEITKSGKRASQDFQIAIGDSAFANCKNLAGFNIALYSDQGKDHAEYLYPKNLPIGKDVFAGCDNVKIYVPRDLLDAFKSDDTYGWKQYKDLIYEGDFGAADYTEDGVIYSYYTSADGQTRYNSGNNTEMEAKLASLSTSLRNFSPSKILVYNQDDDVVYMLASGVNADKINDENGVMKLYSDIGETYPNHYKTLALSASGFQNQTCIKEIKFEDIVATTYNTITDFTLVIPNGTFQGCSNLKVLHMFMLNTKGTNKYVGIKPSQVFIGEHVFDGVSKDFRIYVLPEYYNDYITDPNWSQYKDYIVSCDFLPVDKSVKERNGVTYDYASNVMNDVSASQVVSMKASWWNAAIIAAQVATAYWAGANAVGSAMAVVGDAIEAGTASAFQQFIGDYILDNLAYIYVPMINLVEGVGGSAAAGQIIYWSTFYSLAALDAAVIIGLNTESTGVPINYIANRTKKHFERPATYNMNGTWLSTEDVTNVPRMYISKVNDQETVTIYNDPGDGNGDYQTVAMVPDAFHDKKKLKTVKFQERFGESTRSIAKGLTLVLPEGMFSGCDNFELLDLVNYTTGAHSSNHAYKGLTPDNFIPMGDIFAGVDTTKIKIKVGEEELQEFLDDEYWSKYKNMFVTEGLAINRFSTEWSCHYALAYDKNTLPLRHTVSTHDIDHLMIYAPDDNDLQASNNDGLAALINDVGNFNNYKLDYVKAGAFKGNKLLKTLDICDTHTNIAKVYTGFDVALQDSAFAHCPNFKDLNLIYQVTVGSNHTESMSPSQFALGNGVFDDTPNLRIKFCLDQEEAFLADTAWVKYKDKFAPCFFEPLDEKVGDILLHPYRFLTKLNDGTNFDHVDATRATPEALKTLFKGKDIESFDEFRAFGSCGLRIIYNGMFSGCTSLQTIMLPDSTISIETEAFKDCSLLRSLTIPANVTSIQANAFTGSGINSFIMKNPVPACIDVSKVFQGLPDDYIIYVPDSVVDKYKTTWSDVADHINAVGHRRGLKVVTLEKAGTLAEKLGLTYEYTDNVLYDNHLRGNYAQYDSLRIIGPIDGRDIGVIRYMGGRDVDDCEPTVGHLKYLDLYEAELKASDYTYNRDNYETTWFGQIILNNNITKDNYVDLNMFFGLTQLETLILPKTATKIREHAMRGCTNLKYLVVGDNMQEIEDDAIGEADNKVALIMLGKTAPKLNYEAFAMRDIASSHRGDFEYVRSTEEEEHFNVLITPYGCMDSYTMKTGFTAVSDSVVSNFADPAVVEALKKQHIFSPFDLMKATDITGWVNGNSDVNKFHELIYSSVTKLADKSLTDMKGLQEMSLPMFLTSISKDAFKGCSSLHTINAFGMYVPKIEEDALNDLPKDFVVYVTEGSEEVYRTEWAQYKDHIQGYRSPRVDIREITLTEINTLGDSLNAKFTMLGADVEAVSGDFSKITGLKISGPLGGKDLALIRYLGGREPDWAQPVYTTNLKYLDLYDAELKVDNIYFQLKGDNRKIENENEVPKDMLWKCDNLETVIMPKLATKIGYEACYDMASLKRLVIGDKTTYIDDDALGECRKLEDIIFLCEKKPSFDSDAFTDKVGNDDRKVQRMFIRSHLANDYAQDSEVTSHTNKIATGFNDIEQFRAFGSKAIADEDDLASITKVDGWFKNFPELTNLDVLSKTKITSLSSNETKALANLEQVALPSTLTTIDEGAFADNTNLHWVDLSECDSLKSDVLKLGVRKEALLYAPASLAGSEQTNVVCGKEGSMVCSDYYLTDKFDNDVPKAFTANKVTFGRTFTPNAYTTLTLPFTVSHVPTEFRAYGLNYDGTKDGQLYFTRTSKLYANVPYVVKTKDEVTTMQIADDAVSVPVTPVRNTYVSGNGYSLYGNIQTISGSDAKDQKLLLMNDDTKLWNLVATDEADVQPYTAYVLTNNSTIKNTDVQSKFEDYYYYIGETKHEIDGDGTKDDPFSADKLELVDGLDFKADKPFTAASATYSRTMNNTWATLCLPYAIDASINEYYKIYEVTDISGDNLTITELTGTVEAGRPVLLRSRKKGTTISLNASEPTEVLNAEATDVNGHLVGSYVETTLPSNTYFIANDKFWLTDKYSGTTGIKVKGFRGYVVSSEAGAKASSLRITEDGEATAIDALNALDNDANAKVYDANGSITNSLRKGVNIIKRGDKVTKVVIK